MKYSLKITVILMALITLTSAGGTKQKPKNVILFIGDGMGVAQVYSAMTASGYSMTFPAFPVTGFNITYSANRYVTDSGAAATAFATGEKTDNGMISVRPDTTILTTIMEIARRKGLSTGLVSTSAVTHATPAAFVAHASSRAGYEDIAQWFVKGTADVFIGGGRNHFSARQDSTDLTVSLREMGYDVVYNITDLQNSRSPRIAGLLADDAMPYIDTGRDPAFLATATAKAIETLGMNKKGFILVVEGSQIDWAAHDNNLKRTIEEVLDMDRAVTVAYDFAKKTANTLIVVTADHETGGLIITGGDNDLREVSGSFGTKGHTAVMAPLFAFGPGAEIFGGVQDNTDLFHNFLKLLSLTRR